MLFVVSRCETCWNIKQTETFETLVTAKFHKENFSFRRKFLNYFFSCKVSDIQYVRSTVDILTQLEQVQKLPK